METGCHDYRRLVDTAACGPAKFWKFCGLFVAAIVNPAADDLAFVASLSKYMTPVPGSRWRGF
jgi:hypothetical protein